MNYVAKREVSRLRNVICPIVWDAVRRICGTSRCGAVTRGVRGTGGEIVQSRWDELPKEEIPVHRELSGNDFEAERDSWFGIQVQTTRPSVVWPLSPRSEAVQDRHSRKYRSSVENNGFQVAFFVFLLAGDFNGREQVPLFFKCIIRVIAWVIVYRSSGRACTGAGEEFRVSVVYGSVDDLRGLSAVDGRKRCDLMDYSNSAPRPKHMRL